MSVVPGQDAKDKGNAAFKSGDFPAAIGHYTAAVLADPKNPTYTLNRAAAYLKLGKNEDAERDCDATIALDAKNVKAWFRRGQARAALDKLEGARNDFKKTLVLDPANAAARQELEKVEALLKYREESLGKKRTPIEVASPPLGAASTSALNIPTSTTIPPKRRRVPIKIVDTAATPSASTSAASTSKTPARPAESNISASVKPSTSTPTSEVLMKPVSSRTLTPSASSSSSPAPPAPKTTTFKDLKQAREANKASPATSSAPPSIQSAPTSSPQTQPTSPQTSPPPVRAGGGIFRSNGKHTVFGSPAPQPSTPPTQPDVAAATAKTSGQQGPLTLFAFNRAWSMLGSPQEKWRFLMDNVPPASLPSMFKTSLEASQLVSMLETFNIVLHDPEFEYEPHVKATVKAYLINFSRVPRFTTIVLFMSKDEKKLVKELWDMLDRVDDQMEGGARKVWGVS